MRLFKNFIPIMFVLFGCNNRSNKYFFKNIFNRMNKIHYKNKLYNRRIHKNYRHINYKNNTYMKIGLGSIPILCCSSLYIVNNYDMISYKYNIYKEKNSKNKQTINSHYKVGCRNECDKAKTILVFSPSSELILGSMCPKAALYENTIDLTTARKQHKHFVDMLKNNGINVIDLRKLLVDQIENDDIINLAKGSLKITQGGQNSTELEKYKEKILQESAPESLINMILLKPSIDLTPTNINTGYCGDYTLDPLFNMMFMRDQMITTKKGIVIGLMNSVQRKQETSLVKACLKILNIDTIYQIKEPGKLEGGDFIPFGDISFICNGLRTNMDAINQLLDNKVFGTKYVVVVNDDEKSQNEMHLDTFFNIANNKTAVISKWRIDGNNEFDSTKCDIYKLDKNNYIKEKTDIKFYDYLTKDLNMNVIPVSKKDQQNYGINFLTIGKNKIIVTDKISKEYEELLKKQGIKVNKIDISQMVNAYGSLHCISQAINR